LGLFFSVSEKAPIGLLVRQNRSQRVEEILVILFIFWAVALGIEAFQSFLKLIE
jgi:hypothetical protein